ncbi:MAG: hypothetical protein ACK5PP_01885 [Acidimicrobiales bacterium]
MTSTGPDGPIAPNEVARQLRAAVKAGRVDEVRALRIATGTPGPAGPPDAPPGAVTLMAPRRLLVLAQILLAAVLLVAPAAGYDGGTAGRIGMGVLGLAGAVLLGLSTARWRERVCFDGPRVWARMPPWSWKGPVDLTEVTAYLESSRPGILRVSLFQPDPTGPTTELHGFGTDARARLEPLGPYRVVSFNVDTGYLLPDIGAYLFRYLDTDRCEFAGPGKVWSAAHRRG